MTKGSWIHDDLWSHLQRCEQCRKVNAEEVRVKQPGRLTVPTETLDLLCRDGRSIYRSYLKWLAEPDE